MEMTVDELERISSFIWARLDNADLELVKYQCDEEDSDFIYSRLNMFAKQIKANNWANGITKSVYFFNELPQYVIKIPFQGWIECGWSASGGPEYDMDNPQNYYLAGDYNINDWDYCETEACLYEEAICLGVDKAISGTWFVGYYDDYPIYVSERIEYDYWDFCQEAVEKCDDNSRKKAKELQSKLYCGFEDDMLSCFVYQYGLEYVEKLIRFFRNRDVKDFHGGNVMFDKHGNLYIVDYSGYHDEL